MTLAGRSQRIAKLAFLVASALISRDGVQDARPARGRARRNAGAARQSQAARAARDPAASRQRGRRAGRADRRVVGRAAAAERRAHAAGLRLAAALGVPPERRRRRHPRDAPGGLPPARRLRRARSPPLRAPGRGGARARSRRTRRSAPPSACARRSALWRGDPLADLAFEPFARIDVERLEELRLAALEDRIDADLALGRHTALVPESERSSRSTRCASGCAVSCMLALYRAGRQADALTAYRETRDVPRRRARAGAQARSCGPSSRRCCARTSRSSSRHPAEHGLRS